MLVIRPSVVKFGAAVWGDVLRVAIESPSVEMAEAWDDEGPHLMFADSARGKTGVRVFQEIVGDDLSSPDLGSEGTFRVEVDRGNDADGRVIFMTAVVQSVSYSFSGSRSTREVRLVAVSDDGGDEPVSVIGGG